jgi:hypothetical protein
MDSAKRLVVGTFVSAVTLAATGYVIFGVAFPDFYTDFLKAGSAMGVERQPFLIWAVALGMLSYGALMTLAIGSRSGSLRVGTGMKMGAIVSFLLWFTADFMLYGISNVGSLKGTIIDPLLKLVPGAIAGGVIASALARIPAASDARGSHDANAVRAA